MTPTPAAPEASAVPERREYPEDEPEWFNFVQVPWEDVIMHFVERIGKPLMEVDSLLDIGGELTYVSDYKFTQEEAIDELNLIMYEKGYRFVEREHHIYIVPLSEMSQLVPLKYTFDTVKAFEAVNPRDMDYVVVFYHVEDLPAQKYVDMFSYAMPIDALLSANNETNQIKIIALARDVRKFLSLKDLIDITPDDPRELRFFKIETNAREIERMVRDFLNLGGGTSRGTSLERDPRTGRMVPKRTAALRGAQSNVQMVADERTNSIIVKATADKMKEIAELIQEFDKKPDIGEFETRVVKVEHADAQEVATLLNRIFEQEQGRSQTPQWQRQRQLEEARRRAQQKKSQRGRRTTTRQPTRRTTPQQTGAAPEDIIIEGIYERAKKTVRITAESRQNLLYVYANEEGHARVREMLALLDKPVPDNFKTIALEHAEVRTIAPMVSEISSGFSTSGVRGGRSAPKIVPDESKNLFYVIAERDDMEKVESLIGRLDVEGPEKQRHVLELENLVPSTVAGMIDTLLSSGSGGVSRGTTPRDIRRRSRGGRRPSGSPSISTAGDYQLIPLDDAQILIVICSDEDWAKIEETIQLWDSNVLTNSPEMVRFDIMQGNAQTIAATLQSLYSRYQHPILGHSNVTIQADGDQIFVYGVRPAIEEIENLIEGLDVERAGDKVVILPLTHADANTVAQQLQTMFPGSGGGGRFRGAAPTGPRIQAEAVTNSLIVQAGKADLEKIMDFAQRMDEAVAAQVPEQKFFTLRYAQPRDVAQAVQTMFSSGAGGRGGRFRGQPAGTRVTAVASGSQLIVKAPKEKMAEIEAFINQLDDPKGNEIVIKTIKLAGADVAQIARKLSSAFRQKKNVVAIFDADPSSETILLTCSKDAQEEAERLIAEYEVASKGLVNMVEFRQMRHAQAAEASRWLREQLITYAQKTLGRNAANQIKVSADSRTNRVIINGPEVAVVQGLALLDTYDEEVTEGFISPLKTEARKLEGLDVQALARSLTQTFSKEPQRPDRLRATFTYDAITEMLIVNAPQDMYERINDLIEKFEAETVDLVAEQKFIEIKEADANYIAGQLRNLLIQQVGARRGRSVAQRINVGVDTRLNRITISAPKFAIDMAEALVAELDQPPTTETQLRTIGLENADANAVFNVLRTIFNEKIRAKTLQISVEPLTNSLIVGGNEEDFEDIEKWATELDEKALVKRGQLKIIDILNANPWEVASILNAQYGGGGWGRRSKLGQEYRFDIIAGRSLVIQAPEDKMPDILELIERLDSITENKVQVRTYELPGIGHGIHDLARNVTNAINSKAQARERRITISAYPAADTLIVTAQVDQFDEIEEMMDQFKSMVEKETTVTKFIKLKYLDASRYARTIQDMLANKLNVEKRGSRSMQNLQITPEPRTNQLICYLPEKIVPDLEAVIGQLDVEAEDYEGQLRSIPLAHADANSVAQTLRPMFEQVRNRQRDRDFSQIVVRIQPEMITNSLMVTASDEDFEQIKKWAIEIDEKALVQGNEPQVVDLEYADANEVARLINDWFGARGRHGQSQALQPKASVANGVLVVSAPKQKFDEIMKLVEELDRQDPSGVQIKTYDLKILSATQVQAAVQLFLRDLGRNTRRGQLKPGAFAEPTTNTLVVMAPTDVLPFIDNLIATLEGKAPKQAQTQAYVLTNVRAEQIANNVAQMLKAKVTEREGVKKSSVQTSVFAEATSNRLFVFAPDEYQELAAELIRMVDEEVETGEIVHIIPLENGDAQQLTQSLNQIVQGGQRGGRGGGGAASVLITADAGSNSILIKGLPKDVAEVEQWLTQLETESVRIPELQIFQLHYASTTEVEDTLRGIFGGARSPQDTVTITADEYSGRLFVTANKRKMRQVEKFIEQLDADPGPEGGGLLACGHELYFIDINRGSASDIAWDVRDLLPDSSDRCAPDVEADWFGEYIRITCRPSEFPNIEKLIREFERRSKVEKVARLVRPKGGDPEMLIGYLRARGEDFVVEQIGVKPARETLVESLWDEDEVPPWKLEKEEKEKNEAAEKRRTERGGGRVTPHDAGLSLSEDLLDDIEADLFGEPATPVAARDCIAACGSVGAPSRHVERDGAPSTENSCPPSPFRLASYIPREETDEPPTETQRAMPKLNVIPAKDEPEKLETEVGRTVASPVEKEQVRIVVQPDGSLLIEGPRDEVDDITDAIDVITEDLATGEVIRIFKFRYGDVTAAAEVLSIMFNVQQRQIVIQQPQRGRQARPGEEGRGQQGGIMDQFRGMVGGRQQGRGQRDTGPRMRIATDPGHNYLIIKCDAVDLPEIRELLRELDIPPGEVQVKIIQLKNLLAEETAQNIKDVLGISKVQQRRSGGRQTPTRGPRGRRGSQQQQLIEMLQQQMVSVPGVEGGAKVERVEIIPNAMTNSLMISSPPEVMSLIEKVISDLEELEGRDVIGIHHY
ncbi:MAG: hypothetical protein KAY37_05150, partial [Phycisphaerae bacterium]|nr:hypothetical protein [Phycisphaerae bacterium]